MPELKSAEAGRHTVNARWFWLLRTLVLAACFALPGRCSFILYVTSELPDSHSPLASSVAEFTSSDVFVRSLVPATPYGLPDAIAVNGEGDVFVADADGNRIVEFSPNGTQLAVLTTPPDYVSPTGLTFDASGNLYASIFSGDIIEFAGGDGPGVVIGNVYGARNVVYDPYNGLLYITTSTTGGLYSMPTTGGAATPFLVPLGAGNLRGIAFANGEMYVADGNWQHNNGAIYEFPGNGTSDIPTLLAGNLAGPNEIAVDGQGNLYVAEYYGNDVQEIAPNGNILGSFITGLDGPSGIALVITPEPAGAVLLGGGVLLLIARRRRLV